MMPEAPINAITIGWDNDAGVGQWTIEGPTALIWTDENGNSILDDRGGPIDAQFTPGSGLGGGSRLFTAVLISLFSDAIAAPDDIITDGSSDPRGWWAAPIGSRLWLRTRAKATPDLPAIVKRDIEDALQWLLDDDIVAATEVTAAYQRPGMLGCQIVLKRRDGARAAVRFARVWES